MDQKALKKAILSLHRYFMWANRMRTHFEEKATTVTEQLKAGPKNWTDESIEAFMYMSYWYGTLYIVVEGWQQLKLRDAVVDKLLAADRNVYLLKRYRNGVFHYQQNYFDDRFIGFISEGQKIVSWVRNLNHAFGAYFLGRYTAWKIESAAPKTR
jgi:hypothetical protein